MVPPTTPIKTKSRQILPMPPQPSSSSLDGCTPSASLLTSSTKISVGLGGSITSDVIPIPKSSVNDRNQSETSQIVSDLRRAEDDDVRMYARLVVGMREKIQRDYHANGGVVHPLLKKSLLGVLRTSRTRYDELEDYNGEEEEDNQVDEIVNDTMVDALHEVEAAKKYHLDRGGSSWKVSFIEDELEGDSSVDSPWSTPRNYLSSKSSSSDGTMSTGMSTRQSSTMSQDMNQEDHEYNIEDDFVFCLEL